MLRTFSDSKRFYLILALGLSVLLAVVAHDLLIRYEILGTVYAEPSATKQSERKTRKTPALRQNIYKVISEAQELSDAKEYEQALAVLQKLEKRSKLNAYEKAMISYLKGFSYYSQNEYKKSILEFDKIVGKEGVPLDFENRVLSTLAQLHFVLEEYNKVIQRLTLLHKQQDNPKSQSLFSLAQAYYLTKQYTRSIAMAEKVMSLDRAKGKKTDKNTYLLLQGCYYELKQFEKVAQILETLVALYPEKQYWIQLGAIYSQLGLEEKQMSAMALAHRQGYFSKSQEFEMLAQLYLYHALPYKAARLIESALADQLMDSNVESWSMLGDAWIMAKETDKAISAFREAAELASDGTVYERLVELYSEKEAWRDVIQSSDMAIKKKALKDIGRVYLLRGVAYFNLAEFENSRAALKKAKKKPNTARFAKSWLRYVDREEQRTMFEESIVD